MTVRVVIVDDQALVRAGFRLVLEYSEGITVVGEAGSGEEAVAVVARAQPDVVLMDIRMPGMDGVDATRRIVASESQARVIVLTTFDADDYVFGALRAGASGFLLKDVSPETLVDAIRSVAAGEASLSPSIARRLIADISARTEPPARTLDLHLLTARERAVFRLLAKGLANSEIAAALYVGEATVKTHVARVLMKLGLRDRVQAVVAAYESGVVRPGEESA